MFTGFRLLMATCLFSSTPVVMSSSMIVADPTFIRAMTSYNYLKFDECLVLDVEIPKKTYTTDEETGVQTESTEYTKTSVPYVSYKLCSDCSLKTCNGKSSFLAPLGTVIGNLISFTQSHCSTCSANCEQDAYDSLELSEECSTCLEECEMIHTADSTEDESTNEMDNLWCHPVYVDQGGIQYYTQATCGRDGHMVIGLFSDGQCTVEVNSSYGKKFSYKHFNAMESFCMNCEDNECYAEENTSLECVNGSNQNSNLIDDMNVCSAYQKVATSWFRSSGNNSNGFVKGLFVTILILIALGGLYVGYQQYEKYMEEKEAAEKLDVTTAEDGKPRKNGEYNVMT